MTSVAGLLLAAGAGRRMGTPKALVHDPDGTSWLARSVAALGAGGCHGVTVVVGAESARATQVLADHDFVGEVVVADDWEEGMGASLRAGLRHLQRTGAGVALVTLVDLPDVGADVVARLVGTVSDTAIPASRVLERAAYGGVPGHPVVLGRDHWSAIVSAVAGDRGARDYLGAHDVVLVECGDLATGTDIDTPAAERLGAPAGADRP